MTEPSPFSQRALELQAAADAKHARGETLTWSDMLGVLEPNPDLPDCQSEHVDSGEQCTLPNHHDGPHRAEVTW